MSETPAQKTPRERVLDYLASLEAEIADIDLALQASRRSARMIVSLNEAREGEEDRVVVFNVHDPHWRVCRFAFRFTLQRALDSERDELARLIDVDLFKR
jgi:hypothetical protein